MKAELPRSYLQHLASLPSLNNFTCGLGANLLLLYIWTGTAHAEERGPPLFVEKKIRPRPQEQWMFSNRINMNSDSLIFSAPGPPTSRLLILTGNIEYYRYHNSELCHVFQQTFMKTQQ